MLTVLVILAVLGILFGAAALATYEGDVLKDPHPDDRGAALPATSLQPEDLAELRFDLALRGYRMAEVDAALERLADELATRDHRIAELERALVEVVEVVEPVEPVVTVAEQPAPVATPAAVASIEPEPVLEPDEEPPPAAVEAFEPLEPSTVAPAAISGPLTATTWWTDLAPSPEGEPVPELEVVAQAPAPVVPDETSAREGLVPEEPVPPAGQLEPDALTLPADDEAFSFPELHPPDPAAEEPAEAPQDWWPERPAADGPSGP